MTIATAMEAGAPANGVLLAESTRRLVADDVEVEPVPDVVPKGGTTGLPAYHLVSVVTPTHAAHARDDASGPGSGR